MQLRILKPTPVVPYFVDVTTDEIGPDGKPIVVKEQRGRSYGPVEEGGEDVGVDIDPGIAAEWIKLKIAEDFNLPRKTSGKQEPGKKPKAL